MESPVHIKQSESGQLDHWHIPLGMYNTHVHVSPNALCFMPLMHRTTSPNRGCVNRVTLNCALVGMLDVGLRACETRRNTCMLMRDTCCAGGELAPGWRVDIKMRNSGTSAGTSDAVGFRPLFMQATQGRFKLVWAQ